MIFLKYVKISIILSHTLELTQEIFFFILKFKICKQIFLCLNYLNSCRIKRVYSIFIFFFLNIFAWSQKIDCILHLDTWSNSFWTRSWTKLKFHLQILSHHSINSQKSRKEIDFLCKLFHGSQNKIKFSVAQINFSFLFNDSTWTYSYPFSQLKPVSNQKSQQKNLNPCENLLNRFFFHNLSNSKPFFSLIFSESRDLALHSITTFHLLDFFSSFPRTRTFFTHKRQILRLHTHFRLLLHLLFLCNLFL